MIRGVLLLLEYTIAVILLTLFALWIIVVRVVDRLPKFRYSRERNTPPDGETDVQR